MTTAVLVAVHLLAGVAALAVIAVNLVMAVVAAARGADPPRTYRPLHRAAAGLVGLAALAGLALYAAQHRPNTELHLVYAAAALLTMTLARELVRRDPGRARWYQVGGTALLLGLIFRLLATG